MTGGFILDSNKCLNEAFVIDIKTCQIYRKTDIPRFPRYGHSMILVLDKVYCVGGANKRFVLGLTDIYQVE